MADTNITTDVFSIEWYTDDNGQKFSKEVVNEQQKIIVGSMCVLNGIPDSFYRVKINNIDANVMVEIKLDDEITKTNQFKVNYNMGYVYFHTSLEGRNVMISRYFSRGIFKLHSSRIFSDKGEQINIIDLSAKVDEVIGNVGNINSINQTIKNGLAGESKELNVVNSINYAYENSGGGGDLSEYAKKDGNLQINLNSEKLNSKTASRTPLTTEKIDIIGMINEVKQGGGGGIIDIIGSYDYYMVGELTSVAPGQEVNIKFTKYLNTGITNLTNDYEFINNYAGLHNTICTSATDLKDKNFTITMHYDSADFKNNMNSNIVIGYKGLIKVDTQKLGLGTNDKVWFTFKNDDTVSISVPLMYLLIGKVGDLIA